MTMKGDEGRRKLLGVMATGVGAAALLGGSAAAKAAETVRGGEAGDLLAAARFKNYKARRSASWDRSGGNGDSVPVEPGAPEASGSSAAPEQAVRPIVATATTPANHPARAALRMFLSRVFAARPISYRLARH